MDHNISQKGIDLIKSFEGFRSKPYLDTGGVPTIGYGSTFYEDGTRVKLTDSPITEQKAQTMLVNILKGFVASVNDLVISKINQNQFDALTSFTYNLGASNLKSSTLLKKVNLNPNDQIIRLEFLKWVNDNSHQIPGLVTRRTKEANLYFS